MSYDARDLANYLLDVADEKRIGVSALRIQKVLFFAHGWSLAFRERPLVKNRYEAWPYGPVVRVLWDAFRNFRSRPITARALFLDPGTNEKIYRAYLISEDDRQFLLRVFLYYQRFDPIELSNISHEAGQPWHRVKLNLKSQANLGGVISDDVISESFKCLSISWLASDESNMVGSESESIGRREVPKWRM